MKLYGITLRYKGVIIIKVGTVVIFERRVGYDWDRAHGEASEVTDQVLFVDFCGPHLCCMCFYISIFLKEKKYFKR